MSSYKYLGYKSTPGKLKVGDRFQFEIEGVKRQYTVVSIYTGNNNKYYTDCEVTEGVSPLKLSMHNSLPILILPKDETGTN